MKSAPAAAVKEQFESKEKLVAAVQKLAESDAWLDRVNPGKGLASISNAKLLRLHASLTTLKKDFGGSRDKLIAAILKLEKRDKDTGYKARLERYAAPRLLDMHGAAARRSKARDAKSTKAASTAAKKKRPARSKKAQTKARG